MQCQTCGYELWNLPQPQCPKCSTAFDIRSYRFQPKTIAFACPYCGVLHEGAGPSYLPAEADKAICRACEKTMSVAAMRVVPLVDQPQATIIEQVPWEQRRHLGLWRRWWRTCMMVMTQPRMIGLAIGSHCSLVDAYRFASLTIFTTATAQVLFWSLIVALRQSVSVFGDLDLDVRKQLILSVMSMVLAIVLPALLIVLQAGPAHLFLRITGKRSRHFRPTAIAVLYGQGPMILGMIPVCGDMIGSIWALVVSIIILACAQTISSWQAMLAFLWLPVLVLFFVAIAMLHNTVDQSLVSM